MLDRRIATRRIVELGATAREELALSALATARGDVGDAAALLYGDPDARRMLRLGSERAAARAAAQAIARRVEDHRRTISSWATRREP